MADPKVTKLRARRKTLLAELAAHPGFIRGSLIRTSRAGKDGARREFCFLSRRIAGVNHSTSDFLIPIRNRSCFSEKGLALFSTHR